ncbi:sugar-binding transcriptional regulator [Tissierellaceae bacterium HCP3S3_D8]
MSNYFNKEMVKVSYYYYKNGLTQAEIAKKMNMSRQRVNRILKKALEENIVQIKINDVDKYNVELENKLEERFNLKQSVVINPIDDHTLFSALGIAGAEYLEGILEKGDMIGVTWGKTLSEVAKRLSYNEKLNVSVVQMIGGLNIAYTDLQADEITRTIGKKLGGNSHILYAPAIVENKETKEVLMSDNNLKETFENMEKCNIIIAGIGELKEDTQLHKEGHLNEEYKSHLFSKGCVGDIGFRWYDKDGNPIRHNYYDRTIGYDILKNKNNALVVGIAGGEKKYEAILGALRGRYLDVLITDSDMAERLVSL